MSIPIERLDQLLDGIRVKCIIGSVAIDDAKLKVTDRDVFLYHNKEISTPHVPNLSNINSNYKYVNLVFTLDSPNDLKEQLRKNGVSCLECLEKEEINFLDELLAKANSQSVNEAEVVITSVDTSMEKITVEKKNPVVPNNEEVNCVISEIVIDDIRYTQDTINGYAIGSIDSLIEELEEEIKNITTKLEKTINSKKVHKLLVEKNWRL